MLQLNPSADMREAMLAGLIAQTRHRRLLFDRLGNNQAYDNHTTPLAKGGMSVYKNYHSRTYLHNNGWIDEIPSLEDKVVVSSNTCHCGQLVYGASFSECFYHLSFDTNGRIRSFLGTSNNKEVYTQGPVDKLREYYINHKEIKDFNREQSIAFIKKGLAKIVI